MRQTVLVLSVLALFGSCHPPGSDSRRLREGLEVPPLDKLEAWINQRESRVPGLRQGVAAGIVWADPVRRQKTPLALIYIPGYTATRGETAPTADRIAQALGANLFYSRPTGQGVGPDGHRTVTVEDWKRDALEAFEVGTRLGERVVILAVSTGGTSSVWMTLEAGIRPAATILVSPNLTPKNRQSEMLLWPGSEWLLNWKMGSTLSLEPRNDLQAQFWDTTHHSHSLIPMMQLVESARTQDFSRWPSPVLVISDPEDSVVDGEVTVKLFSRAPAELTTFVRWQAAEDDDHHVLAGEALSPGGTGKMVKLAVEYLRRVLGP